MADPNGLDLRGNPGGRRMARWPVYAVVAVGFCLVGALVYGLQVNDPSRRQEEKKTEIPVNENVGRAPLLPEDNAHAGLVTPPPAPPAQQPAPLLVVQKEKLPPVDPRVENIRRAKSQSYQTALAAPLVVRRFGENTSAPAASPAVAERRAPERERVSASDSDYDPAANGAAPSRVCALGTVYLPLAGLIDVGNSPLLLSSIAAASSESALILPFCSLPFPSIAE